MLQGVDLGDIVIPLVVTVCLILAFVGMQKASRYLSGPPRTQMLESIIESKVKGDIYNSGVVTKTYTSASGGIANLTNYHIVFTDDEGKQREVTTTRAKFIDVHEGDTITIYNTMDNKYISFYYDECVEFTPSE